MKRRALSLPWPEHEEKCRSVCTRQLEKRAFSGSRAVSR
jgi:hypothetical protein